MYGRYLERYDLDCVISCTWDMIRTVWYPVQEIFQKQEMCPSTFRFTRGIHRFNQPRSKTVFSWECQGYQSLVVYSPPGLIMGAAILEKAPFKILNNKMDSKSYKTIQGTSIIFLNIFLSHIVMNRPNSKFSCYIYYISQNAFKNAIQYIKFILI